MKYKKIIAAFALPQEKISITIDGCEVVPIITGVGKALSAIRTTKAILQENPDCVINIGSAGTLCHKVGDIIVSQHFIDRDFSKIVLPGIEFDLHSEKKEMIQKLPSIINGKEVWNADHIINTGDDFVTVDEPLQADAVDMEAFAEMMACRELNVPFFSVKYITDVLGQNSLEQWADKLKDARIALTDYFHKYLS